MLVDVQLKKESQQNTFQVVDSEVFIGQSGNQPFSSLLREAYFLISIQPGTSPIVSKFMSLSWRVLVPSSNLVMWSVTRSPRFLWNLFVAKNKSRLSPVFWGRSCPSSVSSLVIWASTPRRFLSAFRPPLLWATALGQSSPDQLVVSQPTGIAVPLRKIHPLSLGLRQIIFVHNLVDRYCKFWITLPDDFESSASFAGNLAGILVRYHVLRTYANRNWSKRLRVIQMSQCK